jgi:hypothetical protein
MCPPPPPISSSVHQEFREKVARGSAMKPQDKHMGFILGVDRQCTKVCPDAWDLGYVSGGLEGLMSHYRPLADGEVV